MAVSMQILGWSAKGLRCPDHDLDFCASEQTPFRVTLIQMPNGTGKTTTLALLRAALSGVADRNAWSTSAVREFRKRTPQSDQGSFELRLSLNKRRVTIIMNFDFTQGVITYKTTHASGQSDRFDPPAEIKRFMNENFVNFYVFDGELAQNLLDREHTNAEEVVEHLFQINLLREIKTKVSSYWTEKTSKLSAKAEAGRSRRSNIVSELTTRLNVLRQQKSTIETDLKNIVDQLTRQEAMHAHAIEKNKDLSDLVTKSRDRVNTLNNRVKKLSAELMEMTTTPHMLSAHFATSMIDLKSALDRVKLPESAAREFFLELADEDECICGRHINTTIRETIRDRAQQYMGSDNVAFLNRMKGDIAVMVGESPAEPELLLQAKTAELEDILKQARRAQQNYDGFNEEAANADPEVRKAQELISELQGKKQGLETQLQKFAETKDADDSNGIAVIEKRKRNAERKLAEITETINLKAKRDILFTILDQAHEEAKNTMAQEICMDANQRIAELMPNNNIRIEQIKDCLVLEQQAGGSVGETLSIAYAFLSTIFNRSDQQLPFVVDSPAGPLDLPKRRKISQIIPKLSNQFIAFTISSERQDFVPNLKDACDGSIQFITLFRKGPQALEAEAMQLESCAATVDGLTVLDEGFFNDFGLDEEPLL